MNSLAGERSVAGAQERVALTGTTRVRHPAAADGTTTVAPAVPVAEGASWLSLGARRRWLGWTQEQAADRLGVSVSAYARWERGRAVPGLAVRRRVAAVFGAPPVTVASWFGSAGPVPAADCPDTKAAGRPPLRCPACGQPVTVEEPEAGPGSSTPPLRSAARTPLASLRAQREAAGLVQRELADVVGVSVSAYGRWERGVSIAQGFYQHRLAQALGVPVAVVRIWCTPASRIRGTGLTLSA